MNNIFQRSCKLTLKFISTILLLKTINCNEVMSRKSKNAMSNFETFKTPLNDTACVGRIFTKVKNFIHLI
jgi:hypothetical protein